MDLKFTQIDLPAWSAGETPQKTGQARRDEDSVVRYVAVRNQWISASFELQRADVTQPLLPSFGPWEATLRRETGGQELEVLENKDLETRVSSDGRRLFVEFRVARTLSSHTDGSPFVLSLAAPDASGSRLLNTSTPPFYCLARKSRRRGEPVVERTGRPQAAADDPAAVDPTTGEVGSDPDGQVSYRLSTKLLEVMDLYLTFPMDVQGQLHGLIRQSMTPPRRRALLNWARYVL